MNICIRIFSDLMVNLKEKSENQQKDHQIILNLKEKSLDQRKDHRIIVNLKENLKISIIIFL